MAHSGGFPLGPRPGPNPSAPSASHYVPELPYPEELQELLEGRYVVESFLGQGGMGAVYRGLQMPLRRPVAIKILQKQGAPDDFDFEQRFKREAYAMASLTHPHIVQVYDCGDAGENFLFISMELLEGGDLSDAIKAGKVTPEVALKLIVQICDGLQAAHERGIVHRDIKPANIFLTSDGRPKVADFGLAKKFDVKSTFVTKTGLGMGTPDYAAPEQFEPELGIDHRADLYALGVMFYQMLTGRLPRGVWQPPSRHVPVDPRLDEVVSRAMMGDREERWQGAAEMKAAIQAVMAQARTAAVQSERRNETTTAAVKPAPPAPPRSEVMLPPGHTTVEPKSGPGFGILAAMTTLAVIVTGAYFLLKPAAPTSTGGGSPDASGISSSVDVAFLRAVAAAAPEQQVALVVAKIQAINGGGVKATPVILGGKVEELKLERQGSVEVHDISPVIALTDLKSLTVHYLHVDDISCLRGMKLERVSFHGSNFTDISVLRDMPLLSLDLRGGPAREYSLLQGLSLQRLDLGASNVSDISFVQGMPLKYLRLDQTRVADLSPIRNLPLAELYVDFVPSRDADLLRSMPTLIRLNEKSPAELLGAAGGGASPPAPPSPMPPPEPGNVVDLLTLLDLSRHPVAGTWLRSVDGIKVKKEGFSSTGTPRLQFPYVPPSEYDLEVEFTPSEGDNSVMMLLSGGGREFSCALGAKLATGKKCGFEAIDGRSLVSNTEASVFRPDFLSNGKRHHARVEVRNPTLRLFLDGEKLVEWKGNFQRLKMEPSRKLPGSRHLGVAVYDRGVTFHKVSVREVSGAGSVDAPDRGGKVASSESPVMQPPVPVPSTAGVPVTTLPPAPSTPKQTVDLIGALDLTKDRVKAGSLTTANLWERTGNVLTCKNDGSSGKVTAPVSLNGVRDYEIGILVRRLSGTGPFTLDLPVSPTRQSGLELSLRDIELGLVDGQRKKIGDWPQEATGDARVVTRVRFAPDGRHGAVTVSVNGKVAAQWEGALADMGKPLESHPEFPGQQTTSLLCFKDSFAFAAWQLRVYEGEAQSLRTAPSAQAAVSTTAPRAPFGQPSALKNTLTLFDGRTLDGWFTMGNAQSFVVEKECIKATGMKGSLIYTGKERNISWTDFDLRMKVKTVDRSNSGIWIHCPVSGSASDKMALQVQIANENGDRNKTGTVLALSVLDTIIVHDGTWFDLRISVKGKTLTVYVRDKKVNEWIQPENWQPPANYVQARLGAGTIGIESWVGETWFKDIEVTLP